MKEKSNSFSQEISNDYNTMEDLLCMYLRWEPIFDIKNYIQSSQKQFIRCCMLDFEQFFNGLIKELDKCGFLHAKEEFAIPLGMHYHLRK